MKYMLGLNSEELENNDKVFSMFEGVGMIRGENLCLKELKYFNSVEFQDYVVKYLDKISKQFKDKPVWYRTSDLVPHQVNILEGADEIMTESNYLMGTRGIRRNLLFQETFLKELDCFNRASKENPNLGIIFPFVSKPEEMVAVINLLKNKFKYTGRIGMMIEIPSVVVRLDEYEKLGIDNYTVGLNDLTSFLLGTDRKLKENYCMQDKAIKDVLKYIVDKVHSYGKEITIAGYLDKETVEFCNKINADYCNIHYDKIPKIFTDIENPEHYEIQYKQMRIDYNKAKDRKEKEELGMNYE